jgi:hypothetical protein
VQDRSRRAALLAPDSGLLAADHVIFVVRLNRPCFLGTRGAGAYILVNQLLTRFTDDGLGGGMSGGGEVGEGHAPGQAQGAAGDDERG